MRCYPTSDVNFRVEFSDGWDRYCRWLNKQWNYKDLSPTTTIAYWRDLEGAKIEHILMADLYFDNWLKTRLNEGACLPLLYAGGNRFIRLEKDFPAGFRCAPLPMNLKEYREMQAIVKEEEKTNKKGKKGKGGEKGKKDKK
ncbi:PREDICTED: uncharacterized protein LOC108360492 [Rhagoletis zephyria]|uniref:uncharacterized protein LOC108360492 n=1 Tax=Rhagoletis zephyria TaxID=28612 RepID=UPI0008118302|nr:PREDICTED: uncharacterized protein LOC108360492 [Rhagoletis zephyria]